MTIQKLFNLAKVASATTGTGDVTLGAAKTGFLTFADAGVSDGDVVSYGIKDGAHVEIGRGTYSSTGPKLARTTIIKSTNGGDPLDLSGTDVEVFIGPLAEDFDVTGNLSAGFWTSSDVAAAGTCDIGAATTPIVKIAGTTTITSFGTAKNRVRRVHFNGALQLTHDDSTLVLPGSANITTAAGDEAEFVSNGSGHWRCTKYLRATGLPLINPSYDDLSDLPTLGTAAASDASAFATAAQGTKADTATQPGDLAAVATSGSYNDLTDKPTAGAGDVVGPASSTDGSIALFDGTDGKKLKDGGKGIPSGDLVGTTDTQTLTNKTIDANLNDLTNMPMVNVARFGVVGDGTTDDSAALNLALAFGAAGTRYYIPSGFDCFVSSQVAFTVANTSLYGYGAKITRDATYSDGNIIRFSARNCTLEGIEIDGTEVSTTVFGAGGSGSTADGMTIRRCHIHHSAYCVSAVSCQHVLLEDNVFDHCRETSGLVRVHDITSTRTLIDIVIRGNTFDSSDHSASTTVAPCLLVRGDETNLMLYVSIVNNRFLHVVSPSNNAAECSEIRFVRSAVFSGNIANNGSMMISVAGSSQVAVCGNVADGQSAYAIELAGISSSATSSCSVTGNVIQGRSRCLYAVGMQGVVNSTGATIVGNVITSCTQYGVFGTSGWRDVTIVGNRISFGTAGTYGIYINQSIGSLQTNLRFTIASNSITGNGFATHGIYCPTLHTSDVRGNVGNGFSGNLANINSSALTTDNMNIT